MSQPDKTVKVLYVEDQHDVQATVSQMLELMGYTIACADNGQLGVEKAQSWQPDFILMDIRMPVMDGIEATRRIRENPETAHIPIYMLSAYTDAKTRKACNEAGATGFLTKPVSLAKLGSIIDKTVNKA